MVHITDEGDLDVRSERSWSGVQRQISLASSDSSPASRRNSSFAGVVSAKIMVTRNSKSLRHPAFFRKRLSLGYLPPEDEHGDGVGQLNDISSRPQTPGASRPSSASSSGSVAVTIQTSLHLNKWAALGKARAKATNVLASVEKWGVFTEIGAGEHIEFWRQGDENLYKAEKLVLRNRLKGAPSIEKRINKFWEFLTVNTNGKYMSREYYLKSNVIFYEVLMISCGEHFSAKEAKESALEDWRADSQDKVHLPFPYYYNGLFELADNWTMSIELQEYVDFLDRLWESFIRIWEQRHGKRESNHCFIDGEKVALNDKNEFDPAKHYGEVVHIKDAKGNRVYPNAQGIVVLVPKEKYTSSKTTGDVYLDGDKVTIIASGLFNPTSHFRHPTNVHKGGEMLDENAQGFVQLTIGESYSCTVDVFIDGKLVHIPRSGEFRPRRYFGYEVDLRDTTGQVVKETKAGLVHLIAGENYTSAKKLDVCYIDDEEITIPSSGLFNPGKYYGRKVKIYKDGEELPVTPKGYVTLKGGESYTSNRAELGQDIRKATKKGPREHPEDCPCSKCMNSPSRFGGKCRLCGACAYDKLEGARVAVEMTQALLEEEERISIDDLIIRNSNMSGSPRNESSSPSAPIRPQTSPLQRPDSCPHHGFGAMVKRFSDGVWIRREQDMDILQTQIEATRSSRRRSGASAVPVLHIPYRAGRTSSAMSSAQGYATPRRSPQPSENMAETPDIEPTLPTAPPKFTASPRVKTPRSIFSQNKGASTPQHSNTPDPHAEYLRKQAEQTQQHHTLRGRLAPQPSLTEAFLEEEARRSASPRTGALSPSKIQVSTPTNDIRCAGTYSPSPERKHAEIVKKKFVLRSESPRVASRFNPPTKALMHAETAQDAGMAVMLDETTNSMTNYWNNVLQSSLSNYLQPRVSNMVFKAGGWVAKKHFLDINERKSELMNTLTNEDAIGCLARVWTESLATSPVAMASLGINHSTAVQLYRLLRVDSVASLTRCALDSIEEGKKDEFVRAVLKSFPNKNEVEKFLNIVAILTGPDADRLGALNKIQLHLLRNDVDPRELFENLKRPARETLTRSDFVRGMYRLSIPDLSLGILDSLYDIIHGSEQGEVHFRDFADHFDLFNIERLYNDPPPIKKSDLQHAWSGVHRALHSVTSELLAAFREIDFNKKNWFAFKDFQLFIFHKLQKWKLDPYILERAAYMEFSMMDVNHDGKVDLVEFLSRMRHLKNQREKAEKSCGQTSY